MEIGQIVVVGLISVILVFNKQNPEWDVYKNAAGIIIFLLLSKD